MRKWLVVLVLACLTLTACGTWTDIQHQVSVSEEPAQEEPFLLVEGREVPKWRYLYWLRQICDAIRTQYEDTGVELDWSAQTEEGTLAEYAKNQALSDTVLYATVENWAEQYGCVLTADDLLQIAEDWEKKAAEYGGETAYLEELTKLGLNRARAEELTGVGYLYAQLYERFCKEDGLLSVDDAQTMCIDRILISAGAERETARQTAAAVFSQLNTSKNQAAEFTALAAAYDDTLGPRMVTLGDGTLDGELEAAAFALPEDTCSGILETDEGFSILLRLPVERDTVTETAFDELLQTAAERAKVQTTAAYEALDVDSFATARTTTLS